MVSRGQVTPHERDGAPAMTLDSFDAMPPSTRVHAFRAGGIKPHHGNGGRPAGCFDSLDQMDSVPSATGLGDDEHTSEPRGKIGPRVQVVDHETCGSDRIAVNQQNEALWRARRGYRCRDRIKCLFECIAIPMPPLMPEPICNNRHQIGPIRYPDDQFLLHHPTVPPDLRRPAPAGLLARSSNLQWSGGNDQKGPPERVVNIASRSQTGGFSWPNGGWAIQHANVQLCGRLDCIGVITIAVWEITFPSPYRQFGPGEIASGLLLGAVRRDIRVRFRFPRQDVRRVSRCPGIALYRTAVALLRRHHRHRSVRGRPSAWNDRSRLKIDFFAVTA
jgi:hypothetical protein